MQAIEAAEKSGDSDVSHKGAAGRYQIMPATAKELGLTVDSTNGVDERLDPAKAGPAAAGYLQKLHSQFGGDIEKAAAAYNAGPGNVRQAEQKAADLGIPDHWKAFLPKPKETVPYIERFKNAMNGVRG
jgi:soluble lytic murein transglycosylase